ncbi:MAG: SulP family inorganic anion transporter [Alphaproteobacteria bacterium]
MAGSERRSERTVLGYPLAWMPADLVAGLTLAAYAIPVALAYATLAGLPPQVGIYGYLLGGLGYAIAGSSRHLAIGPTSAISLMIAGTVGGLAGGDAERYVQIASLAALTVGLLAFLAWLLRLSVLVKLISDSVLTGFKAGAGLTIAMTQLPALIGTAGGGHNFAERAIAFLLQVPAANTATLGVGLVALALLWLGERHLPGRPVALAVVILSIFAVGLLNLTAVGVVVTGQIPPGLPEPQWPTLRLRDEEGIIPLAIGCLLLAYIEGVAAARTFAAKHDYPLDARRELLGLAAANVAAAGGGAYPVAGGLSQSAVNEKAGAQSRMSLVFASLTLAACLLLLTGFLANLPKAVLAAVVLMAIRGLLDVRALVHMWRTSRFDFLCAMVALLGVLALGILQGILIAALVSVLVLLAVASRPHVQFLGRIPGTRIYSDLAHQPENERLAGVLAFRPAISLLYLNADHILATVLARLASTEHADVRLVICDLSGTPRMDLAGVDMLSELHGLLAARGVAFSVCHAHGQPRRLLIDAGLAAKIPGIDQRATLDSELDRLADMPAGRP